MARRNMTWQELIDSFNARGADGSGDDSGDSKDSGGSSGGSSGRGSGNSSSGRSDSGSGGKSGGRAATNPFGELNDRARRLLRRLVIVVLIALIPLILGSYWWFHPAINIHSADAWFFVSIFILLPLFIFFRIRSQLAGRGSAKRPASTKRAKNYKRLSFIPVAVVVVGILGALLSSVVIPGNAERYASILVTEDNNFSSDIKEVNYDEIPVIDRASAVLLGNRVMGSIPEYVSQFEISPLYSQINYQGHPVRVSPLVYADIFKWFNNREHGIPAYVLVDMTTQNTEIVKLSEPIRYSQSEPLMRNIDRHVQLSYPFYMFDQISFEIDEDGKPWWVCPVQTRTIGLFGGTDIARVVLCDATTGETIDLAIEDCPTWVDRVYPAELLIEQYNWFGAYRNGWINSWLGQEGVVQTTPGTSGLPGYNYIAKDDDVWVYSGVTSAVSDNSIVGFVLVNQRTAESHYYAIAGATEESAMHSAEGQVQHLGYTSTFPLLLNINNQPTYFMALKDAAGLVKMYAMIDIQRYQNVAVGDTVPATQQTYKALLITNGVDVPGSGAGTESAVVGKASGVVARVAMAVIEGNSHIYLVLEGDERVYDCALPGLLNALMVREGDQLNLEYYVSDSTATVTKLEVVAPAAAGAANPSDGAAAAGGGTGTGTGTGTSTGTGSADSSGSPSDAGTGTSTGTTP